MKRILSLIVCTVVALTVFAHERSDEEMKTIAAAKMNVAQMVKGYGTIAPVSISKVKETATYTIFDSSAGEGFVIVSRNEAYPAVIGYSTGSFDADNLPCCMQWWLDGIDRQMARTPKHAPAHTSRASYTPVPPFIKTKWGQADPFNRKAPEIDGQRPPVGCVAVTLAQSMNYYRYPAKAKFDGSYTINGDGNSIDVSVNSSYSWSFLEGYGYYFPEGYTKSEDVLYFDPGRKGTLVAQLCIDCAYAVYMDFRLNGSGSSAIFAAAALTQSFGYPEACVKFASRDDMKDDEKFKEIIYSEMQHQCPVIFGGQDVKDGGHAFVVDGMNEDGLVHVNWGWNGRYDGYYDILLMNPPQNNESFSSSQRIVYGIRTTPLESDKPEPRLQTVDNKPYTFSINSDTDDAGKKHIAIHIGFQGGFCNYTAASFDGEVGLFGTDLTTGKNFVISETDPFDAKPLYGYYLQQPAELYYYYVENELIQGHTYRLSFGGRDKIEGEWHGIICDGKEIAYDVMFTGNAATSTISEMKDVLFDGVREVNADLNTADDGMTRVFDTTGRLVHIAPSAQFNLWEVPARGILVVKQGNNVRKVVR